MSHSSTLTNRLTEGSVPRQLIKFSLPIMVSNLFQTLYSLIDMVVVGQFVGSSGLSAVGIGGQIMTLFLCVGMSIAHAGQVLIAQQAGAGDRDGVAHSIGTIINLEVLAGIVFGVVCLLISRTALTLLNTPAEAWDEALNYTLVCSCGMLFVYGYNALSSVLRSLGDSRFPMIVIICAQLMNLCLDLLFVAGLEMGAGGAALATVLSQAMALIGSLIYLRIHQERLGFSLSLTHLRLRKRYLLPLLRLALPVFVQQILITGSMTVVNSQINNYGVTASAVDVVGQKLNSILYIGIDGMAIGASAMIAQNFGAGNHDRIRKVVHSSIAFCMLFCTLLCLVMVYFPSPIFSLFTSDAEVTAMAPRYIWVVVVMAYASATMCPFYSLVEGIGFANFALVMGILDGVVARIGLGILMGTQFGLYGYWFGSSSAGFVTTIMAGAYYLSGRWAHRKPLLERTEP